MENPSYGNFSQENMGSDFECHLFPQMWNALAEMGPEKMIWSKKKPGILSVCVCVFNFRGQRRLTMGIQVMKEYIYIYYSIDKGGMLLQESIYGIVLQRHKDTFFFQHAHVTCSRYSRELQLWPQTLPLVCEYLVWHLDDPHLMKSFLTSVLVPFWRLHPAAVQGYGHEN